MAATPNPARYVIIPMRTDFRDDAIGDGPTARANRASVLLHDYCGARAIDPYGCSTADKVTALRADLDALEARLASDH